LNKVKHETTFQEEKHKAKYVDLFKCCKVAKSKKIKEHVLGLESGLTWIRKNMKCPKRKNKRPIMLNFSSVARVAKAKKI